MEGFRKMTKSKNRININRLTGLGIAGSIAGSLTPGSFFNPPKKNKPIRKPTMKNLTTTINNQIRLKKKITELKNKLFTEQQKEKDIRKSLEDFEK